MDPALEAAARALPTPESLTATERRALDAARRFHLKQVRGGYAAGDVKVSAKTAQKLEARQLVRRTFERGRYQLIATGAGLTLLDIIAERQNRKANPS
jgi:hypothetical protein